jgi:hypothetical protein
MEITEVFDAGTRGAWRGWLAANHVAAREIWLLLRRGAEGRITYLDAVEEALCFGWIDGIAKRHGDGVAQRFTPRRPRGNWTELNKERARRLIAAGKMTAAGHATLPDLEDLAVRVAPDVEARLREAGGWEFFAAAPALYQRVRLGYVEEVRKRDAREWEKRLASLVQKCAKQKMFGNWDDSGLPKTE